MIADSVLNLVGLLITTIGALLIFLDLTRASRFVEDLPTPESRRAFLRYQRELMFAVGLLALWLVIQALALILL